MSKVITNCNQCDHFHPDPREPSCRKMEEEGRGVNESLLSWEYVRRNVIPPNCPLKNAEAMNKTVMNKKIEELIKEALLDKTTANMVFLKTRYGTVANQFAENIMQRLAELVVQECILTIQKGITRDGNNTEKYQRSMQHIRQIREEFGLCTRCGTSMTQGVAIKPRFYPQWISGFAQPIINRHDTLEIIDVLKCPECGESKTEVGNE